MYYPVKSNANPNNWGQAIIDQYNTTNFFFKISFSFVLETDFFHKKCISLSIFIRYHFILFFVISLSFIFIHDSKELVRNFLNCKLYANLPCPRCGKWTEGKWQHVALRNNSRLWNLILLTVDNRCTRKMKLPNGERTVPKRSRRPNRERAMQWTNDFGWKLLLVSFPWKVLSLVILFQDNFKKACIVTLY